VFNNKTCDEYCSFAEVRDEVCGSSACRKGGAPAGAVGSDDRGAKEGQHPLRQEHPHERQASEKPSQINLTVFTQHFQETVSLSPQEEVKQYETFSVMCRVYCIMYFVLSSLSRFHALLQCDRISESIGLTTLFIFQLDCLVIDYKMDKIQ
jgi:hypothetical protein